MEKIATQRLSFETLAESYRATQHESDEIFQKAQSSYYSTGNDITRIEQTITHRKDKHQQLIHNIKENEKLLHEYKIQYESDSKIIIEIESTLKLINPEVEKLSIINKNDTQIQNEAEIKIKNWKEKWNKFNSLYEESRIKTELTRSNIQHVEQTSRRFDEQIQSTTEELETLQGNQETLCIEDTYANIIEKEEITKKFKEDISDTTKSILELRKKLELQQKHRQENQQSLSEAQGAKSSLDTLQKETLSENENTSKWLVKHKLEAEKKLMQIIKVTDGWDTAIETILGDFIQSTTVTNFKDITKSINNNENINLTVISLSKTPTFKNEDSKVIRFPMATPITTHVSGIDNLALLQNIWTVKSLEDALKIHPHLQQNESVITKEGIWLGYGWLRIAQDKNSVSGVISRQKKLDSISPAIIKLKNQAEQLQTHINTNQSNLVKQEQKQQELSALLEENNQKLANLKATLLTQKSKIDDDQIKTERLQETLVTLKDQLETEQETLVENRLTLQEELDSMEKHNNLKIKLLNEQKQIETELSEHRAITQNSHNKIHELTLEKQINETRITEKKETLQRQQIQIDRIQEKIKLTNTSITESMNEKDEDLQEQLNSLLEKQSTKKIVMQDAKIKLDEIEGQLNKLVIEKNNTENSTQEIRTKLEDVRMQAQELKVRSTTFEEILNESKFDLNTLLDNLSENSSENNWNNRLEEIAKQIERLGPINLAAIDEYEQQSERLTYLNSQNNDLEEALKILYTAIDKIDTETRKRF